MRRSIFLYVAVAVLFAVAAGAEVPARVDAIREFLDVAESKASSAYDSGDFGASAEAYEAIIAALDLDLVPERKGGIYYNLACSRALAGDAGGGLDALETALAAGWNNLAHLDRDPDLDSVRNLEEFAELRSAIETRQINEQRLWSSPSLDIGFAPDLAREAKIAGVSRLWSAAKYNFAFFDQVPELDWDAEYLALLPRVIDSPDTEAYYRLLLEMTAKLRDGHTRVVFPRELSKQVYARPAIRTMRVDGVVLVTEVLHDDVGELGVAPGLAVVAIDGVDVETHARERVAPFVCASTPQDREFRTYDEELLRGRRGSTVRLLLHNASGVEVEVELERGLSREALALVEHRVLDGNVGYLAINTFNDAAVEAQVDSAMHALAGTRALIIDIRENRGGRSGWWVMRHLTEFYETTHWATRRYEPARRAWGYAERELRGGGATRAGLEDRYEEPVALLIGPRTFSAAEDFAAVFDYSSRGVIVGEATGGSTGQPLSVPLPGGGFALICTKRDTYPDGTEFVGFGVIPDVEAHKTIEDYSRGTDSVLDAALRALQVAR